MIDRGWRRSMVLSRALPFAGLDEAALEDVLSAPATAAAGRSSSSSSGRGWPLPQRGSSRRLVWQARTASLPSTWWPRAGGTGDIPACCRLHRSKSSIGASMMCPPLMASSSSPSRASIARQARPGRWRPRL